MGMLVLESNHDVDRLRSGPYPYPLKQRVLGSQGHLSNEDAAAFAARMAACGTECIVLAHLSKENNTPQLAYDAVEPRPAGRWGPGAAVCGAPGRAESRL